MLNFGIICVILLHTLVVKKVLAEYKIGVGIADCTGPPIDIVFMGFAKFSQKGCGIHLRQFSRAFIFQDDESNTVLFVSVDAAMIGFGVKKKVISNLYKIFGNVYHNDNVIISGTHTHGTPGGFLMEFMYDLPSGGLQKETFYALVNGITNSIIMAHKNKVNGYIFYTTGTLLNANINRSPTSYLLNPAIERLKYEFNVDKTLVQLKLFRSVDKYPLGVINWFPVHPTSMNSSNCLVTSDNVGYASILFEQKLNSNALPGKGNFIAAFASTNLGDVSPNIQGPRCIDTGERCDINSSTCNGNAQYCIAFGPGKNMFDSTRLIAERLFNKAWDLWNDWSGTEQVTGPLKFIHQYVDMPQQTATIVLPNGTMSKVYGCKPAMGYSFAAGTTDGPGEFDFKQGTLSSNFMWNKVRNFLFPPTERDIECHYPKPILINSGRISFPYQWQPEIVSLQIVLIGQIALIAVPGEFTTMSGRRLRNMVSDVIKENGGPPNIKPVVAGLSNTYSSYVTTPEEYQLQRYEGASTIYGPHTLTIYLNLYCNLAAKLIKGEEVISDLEPNNYSTELFHITPPVVWDTSGMNYNFGDCILQPPKDVHKGTAVAVKFISGNPRNNLLRTAYFLVIERLTEHYKWEPIANEANWETRLIWNKASNFHGSRQLTVEWIVPENAVGGRYRFRHMGYYKFIFGGIFPYEGGSNPFTVK